MVKKIVSILLRGGKEETDALYRFVDNVESRSKKKVLKQAARLADEEQRKLYYQES